MPTPLIIPPSHPPLSPMQNDRPGPVGGRLRSFAHLWPLVTSDKFVLETVTRGYRIEFTSKPPTTSKVWWTDTPKNPSRREDLERGLQSMLDKKAIREIPVSPDTPGFYSPIFLVAKESGGWRPILNLKAFNKFVVPPSFRMETLRTVMDCLGEAAQQRRNTSEHLRDSSLSETWAISIDLRDAYFHVAVAPEHTRYIRFAYNGRAFEFLLLPFGLSTAPRVFTRIVRVIEAFLKIQGVDMHQYLDDWLMKNQSRSLVERHRDAILGGQTGIPRERGKISTRPHSDSGLPGFDPGPPEYARVPERKENPQGYPPGGLFAGENCPAGKDLAEVSRTLVQPPRVGPHGGSPHTADPTDAPRPVDAGLRQPLRAHLSERGNPRRVRMVGVAGQPSGGSTLPASRSDYVDCDGCLKGGLGRPPWRLGGLRALVKSLGQATHQLPRASSGLANPEAFPTSVAGHCCGCHFRQYHHGCLYQQGGRDSVPVSVPLGTGRLGMVQATQDLSCGQPPVGRQERPRGRPVQRDPPSSDGVDPPQRGDQCNISALAHTHVDLFASEKNHKLPVFFSIRPSPSSSGVNALTQNWDCLYGYAYPPTALIPRVLRKLRLQPTAQILLVAPFWPSQPWFRQMTSMLTDLPRAISQRDDLLKNAVTGMRYPKPEAMVDCMARQPEPDENQLAGFMVPVLNTTKDGVWTEVWTPLKRL